MKIQCERKALIAAVTEASRGVTKRATLPVLSGLRISANGYIEISGTDLELCTSAYIGPSDGMTDEEGKTIVPAKLFAEVLKSLRGDTVTLTTHDEHEIEIHSGAAMRRIKTMTTDDYPALRIDEPGTPVAEVAVFSEHIRDVIAKVGKVPSSDESRQVLTGVLVEINDGLRMTATDSYRLATKSVIAETTGEFKGVVPARFFAEVERASKKADIVRFLFFDDHVSAVIEQRLIDARYLDGEFPNYRQLIPEGMPNRLTVDTAAFIETVKSVALLAQNNLPVKLRLHSDLEVSAHTPDVGEAIETLEASYDGEQMIVAYNPQFLLDALSYMGNRTVLEVHDGLKPGLLHGEGDDSYTHLLMPVRLS